MVNAIHYVYVLISHQYNYMYIGMSSDIKKRLNQHSKGWNKTTKAYKPFSLVYFEIYPNSKTARMREKALKSGHNREWLKALAKKKYPHFLHL